MPDGVTGDGGKWESPTYTSSDDTTNNTSIETKSMSNTEEYAAIAAGLVGVLAISAAKSGSTSNGSVPEVAEGNGIWVPESDRDAVTKMINKAASKEYYIDANGFVKEVPGAVENLSKSSTYASVLDRLIKGDNKVVIGVGDGWVSSGENGLEANAFTGNNSGVTIGDNGTPQVVVVSGKDMPESSADMTLAHELTHALRGEEGIKSINTTGGINQDEEVHTIEVENKIRTELGYTVRKDGDTSHSGDGSYGKYSDASGEDWYNKIDEMQRSNELSGNAYSNSMFGAIAAAVSVAAAVISASSSSGSSSSSSSGSHSSSSSCSHSSSSSYSNYNPTPVPAPIPVWGSSYNDSIWSSVVGAVSNVVSNVVGWVTESKPKQNWDTFWNSATKSLSEGTKNILSAIGTAISSVASAVLGISDMFSLGQLFKTQTGWIKDNDGNWYYYNTSGQKETGWIKDNGKWYYSNIHGEMQTGWLKDPSTEKWYYLNSSGDMQIGWKKDEDSGKWYYFDKSYGVMKKGWINDNGEYYYLYSEDKLATGWSKLNGRWYCFDDSSGKMKTGWIRDKDKDYYCYHDGIMATEWMQQDGKWYYFDESGAMQTGTVPIDGVEYEFDSSGQLQTNNIIDNTDSNLSQWAKDRIAKYTEQLNSDNTHEAEDPEENIQAMKRLAEGGYSEDRINTVLYALDHAYDTSDHDEYIYIKKTNGSDCADFVSQCLNQAFNRSSDWYYWGVNDPHWYEVPKAEASEIQGYVKQYWDNDDTKEWVEKVDIQASASWLKPGALRNYFSDGTHGEAVTTLYSEDDIINAAKNGLIKPGYIATMGSATVSDSHAIIITDVDPDTGEVYYSAHSNERMNRELSRAFSQKDPEDHIYIVKPYYSDGK